MKNKFPLSRIGNTSNPKIVILLANPGGDITDKNLPEHKMGNKYKSESMKFSVFRKYCDWWDALLEITDKYNIKDSYVCSLDYYPYHSKTSKDIPNKKKWDDYSLKMLEKNKKLLTKFINKKIPIFGYYWGHWLKEIPTLINNNFYKSKNGWKNTKRQEFQKFLKKII